jgi:hypothetical protein
MDSGDSSQEKERGSAQALPVPHENLYCYFDEDMSLIVIA